MYFRKIKHLMGQFQLQLLLQQHRPQLQRQQPLQQLLLQLVQLHQHYYQQLRLNELFHRELVYIHLQRPVCSVPAHDLDLIMYQSQQTHERNPIQDLIITLLLLQLPHLPRQQVRLGHRPRLWLIFHMKK